LARKIIGWTLLVIGLLTAVVLIFGYTPDTDPAAMRATYAPAPSRFVDVGGGLRVHVRDTGPRDAPVLVLLHGSNASLHTWEPWAKRLQTGYRVVRFDLPGHGLTGPNPSGRYDSAAFLDAIDRTVRALGITRFALAGNSMGGGFAWRYASAHPDKVSALILVDASGAPSREPVELPLAFRIARAPVLRDIAAVITPRSLIADGLRRSVTNQGVVTEAMIDLYWNLLRYPGNRAATMARFGEPYAPATPAELARLTMPTLILWGADDKLIPAGNARWFADNIPGAARPIVYPATGHLPMEERPDRSARDVVRFLTRSP
jgi:pimeloyl-ACP methyl ester carboxylesterase